MKQLHVRSSSSDQRKHDTSKQKSLDILNASLTCTCNYSVYLQVSCMPPSLCFARQTKELCFIICHRNSSALYGIPPVSYLLRPTYNMLQKEALRGLHTLQWSSFLFFFNKLQPPFSFPSSLLAFLWDLLGSLIVGFSLRKHQRTIFNLLVIKLINLDSLRSR